MSNQTNPLPAFNHAETVGSFLLPDEIKQARADHDAGAVSSDMLKAVEDECISSLVKKQIEVSLPTVTDGEFRRRYWHRDFFWDLIGIEKQSITEGHVFQPVETMTDLIQISAPVRFNPQHKFFDHFIFLQSEAGGYPVRQSIPAPSQLLETLSRPEMNTRSVYSSREELVEDISRAYNETILHFYHLGCRHIQLDDVTWGRFCDPVSYNQLMQGGMDADRMMAESLEVNNLALSVLPDDLEVSTHICRGNHHSAWQPAGDYGIIAPVLFAHENVDKFLVEFDINMRNDFSPLRYIPEGKRVVLGLLATHSPQLEDPEQIADSVRQAGAFIDHEMISISPRCGFHAEDMSTLTERDQWEKISLLQSVAASLWR